jgi:hypothetical protein
VRERSRRSVARFPEINQKNEYRAARTSAAAAAALLLAVHTVCGQGFNVNTASATGAGTLGYEINQAPQCPSDADPIGLGTVAPQDFSHAF